MHDEGWTQAELDEAVEIALAGAADSLTTDPRILAHARAPSAYLALVLHPSGAARALVGIVTHLDGVFEPFRLGTWVRTDVEDYFIAQGAGWWPRPGTPRWYWSVGYVPAPADAVRISVDDGAETIPLGPSSWFAHLREGDERSGRAIITATAGGENHRFTDSPP